MLDPQATALFERFNMPPPESLTIEELRAAIEASDTLVAPGTPEMESESGFEANGVPSVLRTPAGARPGTTILYLHGGGFCIGSPKAYQSFTRRVADLTKTATVVPDYSLSPENPYPAGLDDCVTTAKWCLETRNGPLAVMGDSAGANLVIEVLLRLRDSSEGDLRRIAGAVCLSGWFDVTASSQSCTENDEADPILSKAFIDQCARRYAEPDRWTEPGVSPLNADLAGLPPLLIHVGEVEMLLDESCKLAEKADKAGTEATLVVWPGMFHVFQFYSPYLDAGARALADACRWVADRFNLESTTS